MMESGVASGTGASFEFAEYLLPETLTLIVGLDTHMHADTQQRPVVGLYPLIPLARVRRSRGKRLPLCYKRC